MKKLIALLTAGVLLSSMTAMAATSPSAEAIVATAPTASEGFANTVDYEAAVARGMSAGEYYNNVITSTPGVENATTVGQGGKILINGVATNLTATLAKVDKKVAGDANTQAAALGGTLLNVVKVDFPGANFKEATINFYLKNLAADTKVVVKQLVDGVWVDVEVIEIRADHVVLNLTHRGPVAFVALP